MWDRKSLQNVDELNERLTENVRCAGVSKIGFVRMNGIKRMNKPWWNEDIREVRKEQKRLNRQCRWLKKKRYESEEAEGEYQNAWTAYVKQQRLTERKIRHVKVKCERNTS